MKVLNYGSLNYDYVYQVEHMVKPGETLSSLEMETHFGGKGLNQSVALALAGVEVYHAGMIGEDGENLEEICRAKGVHTNFITRHEGKSGHAIIQVNAQGENCILLYQGSNGKNTKEKIASVLGNFEAGDVLLLQNEINLLDELVEMAYEKKLKIALNPSPMNDMIKRCDLKKISLFLLNEVEGAQLTGETEAEKIIDRMNEMYPGAEVVLTLGKKGSIYSNGEEKSFCDSFKVEAIDTTAAGDTFTGYYIASMIEEKSVKERLRIASAASAVAVTRNGAVPSIPKLEDVETFLKEQVK